MPLDIEEYKTIRQEAAINFPDLPEDTLDDVLQTALSADFSKDEAFRALEYVRQPDITQILFYAACDSRLLLNDTSLQRIMTALGMPIEQREAQRILSKLGIQTMDLNVFEIFMDEVSKL
ncbi:hypothetical protein SS50377_26476 [Spironucleus salmonicida]|uniref:Uncharacterized protein n=1 Tax=Spironucleus salmonicida TaxID=348837 RepID=V6LKX9_9EUKA|nr:hypothetical protein SS50377_26476 [Spironucleus salmonicida]|eukprot:EST41334.1 Hypothetical protein SS50377_19047 [Spironucleus salmonicida]